MSAAIDTSQADLDRTFVALADPTRRGVVDLLRREPRRAGDLATAFGVSPPAMSRHLRLLRRSGLVEEHHVEEDARVRVYRLVPDRFAELSAWVREVESFWTDQLDSFKTHVEARATDDSSTPEREGESQ